MHAMFGGIGGGGLGKPKPQPEKEPVTLQVNVQVKHDDIKTKINAITLAGPVESIDEGVVKQPHPFSPEYLRILRSEISIPLIPDKKDSTKQQRQEVRNSIIRNIGKKVADVMSVPDIITMYTNKDHFHKAFALSDQHSDEESRKKCEDDGKSWEHLPKKSAELYLEEAIECTTANNCRGFTAFNDKIYFLGEAQASDCVHECIHVLSARGGLSTFREVFGDDLLEGFTQYLTVEVSKTIMDEDKIAEGYVAQLKLTKKLVKRHGLDLFCNAYFKGEMDALFENMICTATFSWRAVKEARNKYKKTKSADAKKILIQFIVSQLQEQFARAK